MVPTLYTDCPVLLIIYTVYVTYAAINMEKQEGETEYHPLENM